MEYNLKDDEIMGTDKTFLKRRENGLLLSDKIDELDELNMKLGEYNYYNYTNK